MHEEAATSSLASTTSLSEAKHSPASVSSFTLASGSGHGTSRLLLSESKEKSASAGPRKKNVDVAAAAAAAAAAATSVAKTVATAAATATASSIAATTTNTTTTTPSTAASRLPGPSKSGRHHRNSSESSKLEQEAKPHHKDLRTATSAAAVLAANEPSMQASDEVKGSDREDEDNDEDVATDLSASIGRQETGSYSCSNWEHESSPSTPQRRLEWAVQAQHLHPAPAAQPGKSQTAEVENEVSPALESVAEQQELLVTPPRTPLPPAQSSNRRFCWQSLTGKEGSDGSRASQGKGDSSGEEGRQ